MTNANGVAALRGILKPMPSYGAHLRAGVEITKAGREYVVDEDAGEVIVEKLKAIGKEANTRLAAPELRDNDTERLKIKRSYEEATAKLRAGVIDEPGKPLVLTPKGFEYMRAAFGVQLVNEPWDGQPRPIEAKPMTEHEFQREVLSALQRMDGRINTLEGKPSNKSDKPS
jgi:hypothetical protein